MNIALVTETYPPEINGVAMTLSQLVASLRLRGHRVQVIRPLQRGEGSEPFQQNGTLAVHGLPIPGYPLMRFGLPCGNRLIKAWRNGMRPDIVHVATEGPLGLSAARTARRLGIPCTSTFHTNFHSYSEHYGAPWTAKPTLAYLRWVHNQTRCTMAPTAELCQELRAAGFRNMEILGRGVNLDVFNPQARDVSLRQQWGLGPDDLAVVHASRLAAEKNYDLLIRCCHAIRQTHPSAQVIIVGEGPEEGRLKASLPFARFLGPISLDDRPALARVMASADLFPYPSQSETYGNVLTEAMACGNAVVAFDYAAARLHIRSEENGLTVPLGHEEAFLDATLRLARDAYLRRRLGQAASQSARRFDWTPVLDTFERLLTRHATPAPSTA